MFNSVTDPLPGLGVRIKADDSVAPTAGRDGELAQRGFGGVIFVDPVTREPVDPPETISVPHDYVDRYPWIEVENPTAVVQPAGTVEKPFSRTHTFPQAEALVLHMADGDYRYRVVHQPGKYDDETGERADRAGDPTTHVDWFYVAVLEG